MSVVSVLTEHSDTIIVALGVALIGAIPATIGAIGTYLNGRRLKDGVALSDSNARANLAEVRAIRPGMRYDLENGSGTAIARKTVEHLQPALDEVSVKVGQDAKVVASELADATGKWTLANLPK